MAGAARQAVADTRRCDPAAAPEPRQSPGVSPRAQTPLGFFQDLRVSPRIFISFSHLYFFGKKQKTTLQ